MYPYITIWNTSLSMTWIWVVLSFLTFYIVIFIRTQKEKLKFQKFFSYSISYVLLLHILWKYFYLLFEYKKFFPITKNELLFFLPTVSGFYYNFIGFFIASILFFWRFLKKKTNKITFLKRADIIFQAITIGFIPLWFFLLLWDNFIWRTTNSFLSIHPLTSNTNLSAYDNIFPIWLFLSIWSFISILLKRLIDKLTKQKNPFLWFAIFFVILSIVFMFQYYPRHFVDPLWLTKLNIWRINTFINLIDIKHYVLRIASIWMIYLHQKYNKW